jgi:hypothetical protein
VKKRLGCFESFETPAKLLEYEFAEGVKTRGAGLSTTAQCSSRRLRPSDKFGWAQG